MLVLSRGNGRTVQDFKWSSRLSFFPPLLDHDVVTIHLNALDTSPVGLSCLLIWPCFFGPFLHLSYFPETGPVVLPQRRDLSYFPQSQGMHWSLSQGCMERLDLPHTVWPCFFAPFAEMPQSLYLGSMGLFSRASVPCPQP